MSRMVSARLWPMLTVLGGLVLGALALEGWAASRGNDTLRIAIAAGEERADDEDGAPELATEAAPPVSEAHARARMAARRAQFAEAATLYGQVLQAAPGNAAVEGELGALLLASGAPEQALPHLEKTDGLAPTWRTALALGTARSRLGDREGAERDLRRALALRPASGDVRLALGNLLRRKGALDEAAEILRPAANSGSNEDRARGLVALGAVSLARGQRAEAEASFGRAIEFAPARVEIRLSIARLWLASDAKEDLSRALSTLGRAAELAPDLASVHAALGRARERAGDAAGAREAYDRAVRLDPGHRIARRRLLRLALAAREFGRARHEAEQLVADGPDVPEHHFLAALVADREGRDADARQAYRKAIEVAKGDYPEAWLNLGVLERGAGDRAAARSAYEKAIALRPAYGSAWLNLARLHEAAGDATAAEAAYRKAVEVEPTHAGAWLALGQLLSEARRTDEAVAALKRAVAARPGYDAAELSLGVALARGGRHADAAAAYRALLGRSPRHVSAWYDLGVALRDGGDRKGARDAFEKAGALDAGHAPSRRALAELDLADGQTAAARARVEELLDLSPSDAAARILRADIALRERDPRACPDLVRRLRAELPRDPRVVALSAQCAPGTSPPPGAPR